VKKIALLDVNVLVALFDPDHVHHEPAHDWFADHRDLGWATCPITENGFVRVLSNPSYEGVVNHVGDLVERLRRFRGSGGHVFWSDGPSLCDDTVFAPALVAGHRQITDIYLLGLARAKGGYLATFDRTIPLRSVLGATSRDLVVIGPGPAVS
jgi:uncharacterized protein